MSLKIKGAGGVCGGSNYSYILEFEAHVHWLDIGFLKTKKENTVRL